MDRRTLLLGGSAVVAAGGAAAWYVTQPGAGASGPAEKLLGQTNEFGIEEMTLGDPSAPVEIVEYASFTCPHCARFHQGPFKQLKENYIDTGLVHFGYREVFFDRPGLWASIMARCGGPMRFFAMTDMIYETQSEWLASGDPATIAEELEKLGLIAGLDQETVGACMSDGDFAQNLNAWYRNNAERDDVTSTPSFMIDGQKYSNMSYAEFASVIDERLAAVS